MNNSTVNLSKVVVFLVTFVFSSNLPAFFLSLRIGILPLHFFYISMAAMLFCALLLGNLLRINRDSIRYLLWYLAFILYSVVSLVLIDSGPAAQLAVEAMVIPGLMSCAFVLLVQDRRLISVAGYAVLLATLMASAVSIIEFLNPDFNMVQDAMFESKGKLGKEQRSGGMHVNPNANAYAMAFGLFVSQMFIPRAFRLPLALFVGMAVFTTLSRGGMTLWLLAVLASFSLGVYATGKIIPKLIGLGVAVTLVFLLGSGKIPDILIALGLDEYMSAPMMARISISFTDVTSGSNESRLELAQNAFAIFAQNPIFGAGFGASENLGFGGLGSHNMYLKIAAELGLAGIFIFLSLAYIPITSRSRISMAFFALFLFSSLFTHNNLEKPALSLIIPLGLFLVACYQRSGRRHRVGVVVNESPESGISASQATGAHPRRHRSSSRRAQKYFTP